MCLAIPGKIVEFVTGEPHMAVVEVAKVRRRVNIDLLRDGGLSIDDWVLIHVGFAMSKISESDAREQMELLRMLGECEAAVEEVAGYGLGDEDDGRGQAS